MDIVETFIDPDLFPDATVSTTYIIYSYQYDEAPLGEKHLTVWGGTTVCDSDGKELTDRGNKTLDFETGGRGVSLPPHEALALNKIITKWCEDNTE